MTERTPVTVLGLGSMGSALAKALLRAGHPTTVWNRSPEKAVPLVALGARQVGEIADAVAASPLIISCLIGFEATAEAMAPAGPVIGGRTLITLNSGAPAGARALAAWAAEHGAGFLGGAIKNVPAAVGNPETLLYFGGDRALFDEHAETLRVLGGDLEHLGPEPDLAALYEATLLPALLGFFEGAAVLSARGLPARSMVRHATKWLQMIESLLPVLAEEIDTRDYTKLGSSVALFHGAHDNDVALGVEAGVDMSWHQPMFELLRRAMDEGYGDKSVTALFELLREDRADEVSDVRAEHAARARRVAP